MTDESVPDPIGEMLGQVPADVALHLKDLIRGLEAEAGNARALAEEFQAELGSDISRLRLYAAGLKATLEETERERDSLQQDLLQARTEIAAHQDDRRGRWAR